jgi:hypothetical protein
MAQPVKPTQTVEKRSHNESMSIGTDQTAMPTTDINAQRERLFNFERLSSQFPNVINAALPVKGTASHSPAEESARTSFPIISISQRRSISDTSPYRKRLNTTARLANPTHGILAVTESRRFKSDASLNHPHDGGQHEPSIVNVQA